jgi:hypothetical protein
VEITYIEFYAKQITVENGQDKNIALKAINVF